MNTDLYTDFLLIHWFFAFEYQHLIFCIYTDFVWRNVKHRKIAQIFDLIHPMHHLPDSFTNFLILKGWASIPAPLFFISDIGRQYFWACIYTHWSVHQVYSLIWTQISSFSLYTLFCTFWNIHWFCSLHCMYTDFSFWIGVRMVFNGEEDVNERKIGFNGEKQGKWGKEWFLMEKVNWF